MRKTPSRNARDQYSPRCIYSQQEKLSRSKKTACESGNTCCSPVEVRITAVPNDKFNSRRNLQAQSPCYLNERPCTNRDSLFEAESSGYQKVRSVEGFQPIEVPTRDCSRTKVRSGNQQIEIHIQKSESHSSDHKKLLQKISHLTGRLEESELQRTRLSRQLEEGRRRDNRSGVNYDEIRRLQAINHKLDTENKLLKRDIAYLKSDPEDRDLVVEKPIEVIVEVPKYIPGPERVVQRIVEVNRYFQRNPETNSFIEINGFDSQITENGKIRVTDQKIEVPVYVDRHVIDEESLRRARQLQDILSRTTMENNQLRGENGKLKIANSTLQTSLDVLRRHNEQKNKGVETMLRRVEEDRVERRSVERKSMESKETREMSTAQRFLSPSGRNGVDRI